MKIIILFICSLLVSCYTWSQTIHIKHQSRDKTYVKDFYKNRLILRAYEGSKFNNFKFVDGKDRLVYRPNHHYDLGLGFSYKAISANIEFYIPIFGQSNDIYGTTHSFDFQTYVYVHKFVFDFYGQYYHGYYLANADDALVGNPASVIKRPDITTKDVSLICQYVFNDRHFSFNAPFYQNEIQEKSAGSFLVGGGIYHNDGNADSSFIPSTITHPGFFHNYSFHGFGYTGIGPDAGYAYTQVIRKHFFVTASVYIGCGVGYGAISNGAVGTADRFGIEYMLNGKFAAGYTNDKFFLGITYIRLVTELNSVAPGTWEQQSTGNFRLTFAKRFRLKKEILIDSDLIKMD